ncbi:unnamed protein product, partial [Discosporangium mesarthrocarpum]
GGDLDLGGEGRASGSQLSLTQAEMDFFSRTGIVHHRSASDSRVLQEGEGGLGLDEGHGGLVVCGFDRRGGSHACSQGDQRDIRASISNEDLLQGLVIQNQKELKDTSPEEIGGLQGEERGRAAAEVADSESHAHEDQEQGDSGDCIPPSLDRLMVKEESPCPKKG